MKKHVHIRRDGLLLRLFPLSDKLEQVLKPRLTYTRAKFLATRYERMKAGGKTMQFTTVRCYKVVKAEVTHQLLTNSGYFRKIVAVLQRLGYTYDVKDLRPLGRKGAFAIRQSAIDNASFRNKQKEPLLRMVTVSRGQIHYPTGAGKSYLVRIACLALPKARILYTTKHQAVLKEVYAALRQVLPSVGIYCSEKKQNLGARVMCCSAGSLHKAVQWRPDMVLADETQELATEHFLEKLSQFRFCRFIGLSANYKDRADGSDFELEGLFGPVVATLTYEDAVAAGLIVPITVRWRHVFGPPIIEGEQDRIVRQRIGLWRNSFRNAQIAADARLFPDEQVLIIVKTVEHAVYLRKHLPEFELCYSQMSEQQLRLFKKKGLLPEDYRPITTADRDAMKHDFESGKLRKVIATSVWNRGVNFHKLSVVIRADPGASKVSSVQETGRLSRLGKPEGILIDYWDEFDTGLHNQAQARYRQYRSKKWKQIEPEDDPVLRKSLSLPPRKSLSLPPKKISQKK